MTALALIVTRSHNGVIGLNGKMPWHIPADLRFFKETTTGYPVIMGWNTWVSIGRPLPRRRNIVLSRTHTELIPGIEIVRTLSDALLLLDKEEKAFVIGGAYTYREALPRISEAYITEIDQDFDGDTFFTMTDPAAWNIEEVGTFEDGGCTGRFTHWVRK